MPAFMRDRTGFLERCRREQGDVARLRFGPHRALLVNQPEVIDRVLVRDVDAFPKLFIMRNRLRPGDAQEPESRMQYWPRADMARMVFHRDQLASYSETITGLATELLDGWQDGETREILSDMLSMTLMVIMRTLFDADVRSRIPALQSAVEDISAGLIQRLNWMLLLPDWLPTRTNRRSKRAMGQIDELLDVLLPDGIADRPHSAPMLAMLHAAAQRHAVDYTEARRQALAATVAGYESSGLSLAWFWYLVAQHPEVVARLEDEVDGVLGGQIPTFEHRSQLPYMEMVFQEVLRLYPPVWVMTRRAAHSTTLGGQAVSAGTFLLISPWLAQRHPEYFPDPECFRPDRWADGLSQRLPRFAYFPFSAGSRVCPGANFAMHELMLIAATMIQRVRLLLVPDQRVTLSPTFTLRPSNGIQMIVQQRQIAR
jgi:cytochrome P450